MILKPHTIQRRLQSKNRNSSSLTVNGVDYGEATEFRGQLTPMTVVSAIEATGIEHRQPHMWIWDDDPGDQFPFGCLLQYNGKNFIVQSPTRKFDIPNGAKNYSVVVEELQYALA